MDSFGPDSIATKGESFEMSYEKQNIFWFKESFTTDLPVHLLDATGKRAGNDELVKTKVNTYRQFDRGAPQMKIIYTEHSGHHIQREQPELVVKSILLTKYDNNLTGDMSYELRFELATQPPTTCLCHFGGYR